MCYGRRNRKVQIEYNDKIELDKCDTYKDEKMCYPGVGEETN